MRKGSHATDEQRAKLSAAHKNPSPEMRAKMVATMSKPETRAKLSAALKGNTNCLGHYPSDETRAKISAANWKGGTRISCAKSCAKHRVLGFTPLNEPFPGSEGHHVDSEQVINEPKALHRSVWHCQRTGKGMAQSNAIAYNFLFKQEVDAALSERTNALVYEAAA